MRIHQVCVHLRLHRLIVVIVDELGLESTADHLISILFFLLLSDLKLCFLAFASKSLRQ